MKAALIGLGPHGKRVMDAIAKLDGIELSAVVDQRAEALQAAEIPPNAKCYLSANELWADQQVDLVCITTNGPSHAPIALEAMTQGVHYIMVEKPMACSVVDCERMIDAANRYGARLSVNQSRRHDPLYRWLRDRIHSGEWGTPRCVWIQRPGIGLGCLATHSFDLARFLTGRDVEQVTAWVDEPLGKNPRGAQFIDPGGLVVLEMGSGLRAVITQIEDGAGPMSVELDFTAGRVRLDEKLGTVEIIERDMAIQPGPGRPAVFRQTTAPDGMTAKTNMATMLQGVLQELVSDQFLECEALHGKIAIEVLVAAYVSHRNGHAPVALSELSQEDKELCLQVT